MKNGHLGSTIMKNVLKIEIEKADILKCVFCER